MNTSSAKQRGKGTSRDKKIDRLIGETLRSRREKQGMSQTALGELLGVTFQQIQKYEWGINSSSGGSHTRPVQRTWYRRRRVVCRHRHKDAPALTCAALVKCAGLPELVAECLNGSEQNRLASCLSAAAMTN